MGDSLRADAPPVPVLRVTSMDQFRGLTILLMFAVHYAGFSWGVNLAPVFRHNGYYLSVGDLAFPWFHLAAGFALRLTLLRRLRTHGAWAAYGRVVRRCLLLILLGNVEPLLLGGLHVSRWGPEQRSDPLALLATYVKLDGWTILAIIGVTSLWVAPVIGRSVRVRVGFLLGGLALHALAMQVFYLDFMRGRPNFVEAALGTIGVPSREGGPLGFLVWAVPQLVGSLVYDLIVAVRPERCFRVLLGSGLVLVGIGYGLSCLSSFYPVAQGPRAHTYVYPDSQQPVKSPVIPPFREGSTDEGAARLPYPPCVPPPPERQRVWNYWMMSRHLCTPTFMLTATDFGLITYAFFVFLCDARALRVGVLRTLGQNPLIAYLLDMNVGGLMNDIWPEDGGLPWALAGAAVRFALAYVPVRLLEWRRIYLRL